MIEDSGPDINYESARNVAELLVGVQKHYDEDNFRSIWPHRYLQNEDETGVHNVFYQNYVTECKKDPARFFDNLDLANQKLFYQNISNDMGRHTHLLVFRQIVELGVRFSMSARTARNFEELWRERPCKKEVRDYSSTAWKLFLDCDESALTLLAKLEEPYAQHFFQVMKNIFYAYTYFAAITLHARNPSRSPLGRSFAAARPGPGRAANP